MLFFTTLSYRFLNLFLVKEDEVLTHIFLAEERFVPFYNKFKPCRKGELFEDEVLQLSEYFCGKRKAFDIKYTAFGTRFQHIVWQEISKIEYATVETYSSIAKKVGIPKGCRAVANACAKNPLPVVVPCHRVVGKAKLGGYMGDKEKFASLKAFLLSLEEGGVNAPFFRN